MLPYGTFGFSQLFLFLFFFFIADLTFLLLQDETALARLEFHAMDSLWSRAVVGWSKWFELDRQPCCTLSKLHPWSIKVYSLLRRFGPGSTWHCFAMILVHALELHHYVFLLHRFVLCFLLLNLSNIPQWLPSFVLVSWRSWLTQTNLPTHCDAVLLALTHAFSAAMIVSSIPIFLWFLWEY